MKKILEDPRIQLSITLLLIFTSAVFYYHRIDTFKLLTTAIGSSILFDFIFLKIRKINLFPPYAAITTGLIISLLIAPTIPLYQVIIASGFAMFAKNIIKGSNRHIFNPAGFGIIFSSLIFHHPVSWWAVSFQPLNSIFFLILLSTLLVSMIRLKRFPITLPFLLTYFLVIQIINHQFPTINFLIDPTVLFFSLVMLPEPQTTPNKTAVQIAFGIFVALFVIFSSKLFSLLDPLIFALLAGNLLFYRLK